MSHPYEEFKKINILSAPNLEIVILLYNEAINVLRLSQEDFSLKKETFKEKIEAAQRIIRFLRNNLDFEKGEQVSKNLSFLYSHFNSQLEVARQGISLTDSIISGVIKLLSKIRDAWIEVADEQAKKNQQSQNIDSSSLAKGITIEI